MSNLGSNWARLTPYGNYMGLSRISWASFHFSVTIFKSPRFVPFGANPTHLDPNLCWVTCCSSLPNQRQKLEYVTSHSTPGCCRVHEVTLFVFDKGDGNNMGISYIIIIRFTICCTCIIVLFSRREGLSYQVKEQASVILYYYKYDLVCLSMGEIGRKLWNNAVERSETTSIIYWHVYCH